MIVYPPCPGTKKTSGAGGQARRRLVQWRQTNVEQGVVRVDEALLSRLIKNEPIQKYYKIDTVPLSTGMFSEVRRCRSLETGQVLAAKFSSRLRYGEDCTKEIHHEIALLSLASPSPRIIKLHDVFQTKEKFIIIMEFAPGGDMQTIIDENLVPFESDVVKFVEHVVEGLAYLHQRKIAHLDIKPQNLVMMGEFPNCDIKVCDFEISRVILDGCEIHEILGTPEYVAPEILHYEPITLAADMWSLGVTTYALLTGFSPFGGETDQETFLNISQAQVDFPEELFEDISSEAKDFVSRLLKRNPRERMAAKECLKHPWLAKHRKAAKVKLQCKQDCNLTTGEPRRVGCSSCPPPAYNLRNYLSKSREALFEKVVSQQRQLEKQNDSSLRKTTLLQQVNKTRRLCESQMSLVSKSRERVIAEQQAHLTRSREKLYGLRTLSKSHEVLNLYKSLANLHQDDDKPLPGILKSIKKQTQNSDDNLSTESIASSVVSIVSEYKRMNKKDGMSNDMNEDTRNNNTRHNNGNVQEIIDTNLESNGTNISNENYNQNDRPFIEVNVTQPIDGPASPQVSNTDNSSLTEFNSTTDSDISEEDSSSSGKEASTEEDEPRFTVKQLVSAYNKHQEIVTKTSLEVTMSSDTSKQKIGTSLPTNEGHKFPTGPNALRLFIPDIKITSRKKRMPKKKTGLLPPPTLDVPTDVSSESIDNSVFNLSAINARLNETITLPIKNETAQKSENTRLSRSSSNSSICSKSSDHSNTSNRLPADFPISSASVAKTVQLFNSASNTSYRPNRKSFSTTHTTTSQDKEKSRRKSSPPTSEPFF